VNAPVLRIDLNDPTFYVRYHLNPCLEATPEIVEGVIVNQPWHGFSAIR
jgi:hypothetical protein